MLYMIKINTFFKVFEIYLDWTKINEEILADIILSKESFLPSNFDKTRSN